MRAMPLTPPAAPRGRCTLFLGGAAVYSLLDRRAERVIPVADRAGETQEWAKARDFDPPNESVLPDEIPTRTPHRFPAGNGRRSARRRSCAEAEYHFHPRR